jgi:hydrogenase-4 component B
VIHAVGSRQIDHYGGLLKLQPWTGAMFLGGAVAICGLPPLNGFVSEWLIYLGSFQALKQPGSALGAAVLAAPVLALIGGLALACFVKVFGIAFLGEPRSAAAAQAHEAPVSMLAPMVALLVACAWIGLLPTTLHALLQKAVGNWAGKIVEGVAAESFAPLRWISLSAWLLLLLVLVLFCMVRWRSRPAPRDLGTWGCGYRFPAVRMQYTASSFADFLIRLFAFGLRSEEHGRQVPGLFPLWQTFSSHTPDAILDRILIPAFQAGSWLCRRLRAWFHNGSIALYLLYVIVTVIVLLTLFTP